MCDRGMLEANPDLMKLENCIAISTEIQQKLENGVSELIGEKVYITTPKRNQYPWDRETWNRSGIVLSTDPTKESFSTIVAKFSLKELPGCCGVLVSFHTHVTERYRGKGINTFLQSIKEDIAGSNGYTLLMATVNIVDNPAEVHVLEKSGWARVDDFTNSRTGNHIGVFTKKIGK